VSVDLQAIRKRLDECARDDINVGDFCDVLASAEAAHDAIVTALRDLGGRAPDVEAARMRLMAYARAFMKPPDTGASP
jgi:hypothetical protein